MIKGSPLRSMLQFALPLLIGNLLQQTYNIIDAAIVGQVLGAQALASVGASTSVQFLVLGFCMGICTGFGYNAICFADQTAWVTACCYIAPTCFYCVKKVTRMLQKGESETV